MKKINKLNKIFGTIGSLALLGIYIEIVILAFSLIFSPKEVFLRLYPIMIFPKFAYLKVIPFIILLCFSVIFIISNLLYYYMVKKQKKELIGSLNDEFHRIFDSDEFKNVLDDEIYNEIYAKIDKNNKDIIIVRFVFYDDTSFYKEIPYSKMEFFDYIDKFF